MQVLDDVEEERGVHGTVAERKAPGDVPGEEVRVGDAAGPGDTTGDGQVTGVVVEAVDPATAGGGNDRVGAVGAADVDDQVGGRQVLEVPVVPRRVDQVLGVDEVRALAGVAYEPHADRLALAVDQVDGAHQPPGRGHHRGTRAA